ncbi:hypothetical protein INR49_000987 [Caranx melampygus]|nr:hypothetical protein INR49_000987 [Caranx melampygus]
MSLYSFGLEPLSCHAWNKDRTQIAVSPNNNVVNIYEKKGKGWIKIHELTEHSGRITGIDWAPESNRIVTCASDRNAYVWTLKDGVWKPTLVLVRINRAATCVKWSPLENKFALGSGARLISVCYFEKENDWWLSKHIKKPIRSTVLCLAWHPNNILLAAGSADLHCSLQSTTHFLTSQDFLSLHQGHRRQAWTHCLGGKNAFGELLLEHKDCGGWVHSVSFSPSGDHLAWVAHNSSITVADATQKKEVTQLTTEHLPLLSILYVSPTEIVAAAAKSSMSAMQHFRNLDKKATDEDSNELGTLHQNSITQMCVVSGERAKVEQYSSVGLDGAMVIWDFKH